MERIAVVGVGCRYPDAENPDQLWQSIVSGRRAFRKLPAERISLDDYYSADAGVPDRFYSPRAALIEGWEFDRSAYNIAGSTFRSTDLTHWLALEVATQALANAGIPDPGILPRERTGVIIGNTLTGEFSRANGLRLRWPYVRRTLEAELRNQGWLEDDIVALTSTFEHRYKAPFPAVDEDTLAGGLANTIAGRICNYYDFQGGGFTVDGACSSSLLSVFAGADAIVRGDLDVALAGGVDLSIDPFELVGFAKTGALSTQRMRLYDRRSNGFWPGEGCGMLVLMREGLAEELELKTLAYLAGWGMSSDGAGGMTRPEISGYKLALRRAYDRAGFGIETVPYFEGHGTGTAVGDLTELTSIDEARRSAGAREQAAIGSIKGQIGHTKAAAGVAGLIKAILTVRNGVVPPTVGCIEPHEVFGRDSVSIRPVLSAEEWPEGAPRRAGVTSMGFGGINTHAVVEADPRTALTGFSDTTRREAKGFQNAELLLFSAEDEVALRAVAREWAPRVEQASYAELQDHAVDLSARSADGGPARLAVVATDPLSGADAIAAFAADDAPLTEGVREVRAGVFTGIAKGDSRIGFLFPGQGTGSDLQGRGIRPRFDEADHVFRRVPGVESRPFPTTDTRVTQPYTLLGSLASLAVLGSLGIVGQSSLGHSLGEITALVWAGVMSSEVGFDLASERGRLMTERSAEDGFMASLDRPVDAVERLLAGLEVVIAAKNSPAHTVVAGPVRCLESLQQRCDDHGVQLRRLPVSHAFHSPLMEPVAEELAQYVSGLTFESQGLEQIVSTVRGRRLRGGEDVVALLIDQVTDPVEFTAALHDLAAESDLLIEVGPGSGLSQLARSEVGVAVVATDGDQRDLSAHLGAVGAAWVLGSAPRVAHMFAGRAHRAVKPREGKFLANPTETIVEGEVTAPQASGLDGSAWGADSEAFELLAALTAERAEIPATQLTPKTRPLEDLHLSSITIGQVVTQAASVMQLGAAAGVNLATSTLGELAAALDRVRREGSPEPGQDQLGAAIPDWIGMWTSRPENVDIDAESIRQAQGESRGGWQLHDLTPSVSRASFARELTSQLERALAQGGHVVLVDDHPDSERLADLLAHLQRIEKVPGEHLLVIGGDEVVSALIKTYYLEYPTVHVTHLVGDPWRALTAGTATREVLITDGFSSALYSNGNRLEARLHPVRLAAAPDGLPDGAILAVGGGKGITAECALAMATQQRAPLGLIGRADVTDGEVADTLERARAAGLEVAYASADVSDRAAVDTAVAALTDALGEFRHLLYGAGYNVPATISNLGWDEVGRTRAAKAGGLRNVLDRLDPTRLRSLTTFGSIIGRFGLWGEAHYAMANAELATVTALFGTDHPGCRSTCIEWSVWSEVGMGDRLGAAESLAENGISVIEPSVGVGLFCRIVGAADAPDHVIVSGRTTNLPTAVYQTQELPLFRFLESTKRHYPGHELVVDAALAAQADRYLDDHRVDGNILFPAVMGLEAMAQVGAALAGESKPPRMSEVRFERPIVIPEDGETRIRIVAVRDPEDNLSVSILSEATDFAATHFSATLSWNHEGGLPEALAPSLEQLSAEEVALDPDADLYPTILFQRGRFQRLHGFQHLASKQVVATIDVDSSRWFQSHASQALMLGDGGARDAYMHANQASIPDSTLIPEGVEEIVFFHVPEPGRVHLLARERDQSGTLHTYDLDVFDERGVRVESWRGLRLRAISRREHDAWPAALLGPHLERVLADEGIGCAVTVGMEGSGVRILTKPDNGHRVTATAFATVEAPASSAGARPHRGCLIDRSDGSLRISMTPQLLGGDCAHIELTVGGIS